MKFAKRILFAAIVSVVLLSQSAKAQSCDALLTDLIDYAAQGPLNVVDFQMTGNRGATDWAQYTRGVLHYTPGRWTSFYYIPPKFSGEAEQLFSDRIWSEPAPPPPPGGFGFPGVQHPFNPYAKDKLRVSFNIGLFSLNAKYGDLTYTLLSWGNASEKVTPECHGNYMYAFLDDQMLTFSFKKSTLPAPPR